MKLLALLALSALLLSADNPRARFRQMQAEARAAAAAGDSTTAETKYLALLDLAPEVGAHPQDVYAGVLTPLAQIYRDRQDYDRLEALYHRRVEQARGPLELGLAQADRGFFYQNSETSGDRFRGEEMVAAAIRTFEGCTAVDERADCRQRLLDTAGLQGAIFFQQGKYATAEPLFRRVLAAPEPLVQKEVLLVSMHALRGILVLRKEFPEARELELRAAALEAQNPKALARILGAAAERSRARD